LADPPPVPRRELAVFTKLIAPAAVLLCTLLAPLAYVQLGLRQATARHSTRRTWAVESLPGSIVLAGGTFIDPVGEEVVRLGGGEKARVVLIPTAYGPTEEEGVEQFRELWSRFKPASIAILHTRDRDVANDPEFVKPLRDATAVWFLGGVQTRLLETYENTLLHREVRRVFERGGVVGGNCAGAMALGETMIVRGEDGESDDDVVLRPGFGLVPKMVADSHWLERNRIERLRGVIEEHPDHFGIGIDGETAVVIDRGHLRCIGKSYAATIIPVAGPQAVRFDIWAADDEVNLSSLFAAK
jgi:cyanophycinase